MKRIWGFGREKGMSPLGSASGLQRQGRGVGQKNNTTDNLLLGYHVQDRDLRKIHKAAWMGNAAQVQQILFLAENGVDDRDKMNRTALHLACANGHPEVVTLLVERKCHLNLCDHENRTALMKAVQCQEEKCVNILLENGADPNIRDVSGNTALHYAAFGDNISIIEKLLLYNANTEARNKDNITPLLVAVNENKQQIVEVLVEKAANIHAEDKLKSSYEIICRHKEEIMLKNSLQSSHPGADKNAEEDSIARLSDQPAPDDSWSTSSSQVLDFGTKSMSEKPNKDVPHVSGAVDQKGQRILHGQVEGADKNAEEDSIARLSDKPAPDDSWSTSSSQVLDFGTKYQVPLKVEEKKKHRGSDMEVSENIYDAAAAGLIPQRQNGKTDNHQLPITENKDSDRREPGLHMKKLKKGENEKGTSKGSVITPVLQKADALTGGPLQKNDGSHFSEKDQHESRPAKKISKKKNKVKKQITSMDDLVDFIQSSKTASEHCELPYSKNFMLLIEQLGMDCKDYAGFLKIQDIRVSYEKLRKLNKKHCKLLMGKMTKMDKMVSALQNELQEAKDMISRLEHQKVEWEREFCSLRCTLKQEEEEEEEEERRNTDMLYENIREKLRSKEDEYKKEVETKQQVELALRMLNTELKATKNQVVEERSDTQWQLSPEQKARVLQDGSLNNLFCKQKELEMAHKKTNSKVVARQLQQELADTLKKKSMSEASPEVTSYLRLEDETRDLKKKLAQITSQLQEEQERHGEAVRCAEEMKDHVQKLQVKNATQEATIKHQAAQIQDLENNMIKTSLLQEAQERHAEAERYAEKIKDHMLKLKVKNARQEATIKHQAAQIQDLQSNLLKASLLQEAKDREAKDIRYAEKTLEVQNARAEETIKQQAAHIHNLPSNLLKTSLADVLTTELETTSSKYLHLDAKNQVLQESLSMKAFKEECEKLESNNKKLQQEVVKLKQFMEMNMVQRSQVEQYKQEIEERARLDIVEKLHEVNLFLQAQAAARQNLDQLRENNHASMRNQMELRIKDLESQVSTMKTSPDSTKTELETYRQLYLEELKLTTSLRNKLNRAKERLSESNTNFLVERQQHQTLLRTLTMSPGLEPPYCGHFENNLVLNGNLTPRGNLVIPTLNPRPSYDDREASLWKMRQELEERITRALEEDATKFE
ncbi:ankyrin repeat domain-containing protein 26-like isoform X6 [Prionailurus bengalensis]|uniref:ankyrin repeat domain-containing protein 26-like isoform X6 n=1 Tax=Prionailurus bengalensis TaxID=37029 RepID=UPI001CA93E9F|nr:ankyrin repeat domain-containing protein 26-like isoform X6 [Prionailurus bengalensis]